VEGGEKMYEQINDELIKQTIGKYDELTREIHEELKRICKVFSRQLDEADLIEAASIPGRDDVITGSAGGMPGDLLNTYERYKCLEREQIEDTARYMVELTSKQETMNRIMTCFRILPLIEQRILMGFYGPGQYFNKGRVELPVEIGMSLASVKRIRTQAIEHIKELYQLEYSQMELYQFDIKTHSLRSYR
jgi:hypothetical protein